MNQLRLQYGQIHSFGTQGFFYELRRSAAAFLILAVAGYVIGTVNPAITQQVAAFLTSYYGSLDLEVDTGSISALMLFGHNVQACLMAIFYGIIPYLSLTALALGMNSLLLGILAVYIQSNGYSLLYFLAGILPHGIFEIPALVLAFALGLYLCKEVTARCRHQEGLPPFSLCLAQIARVFVFLVVPLLAVSAATEVYLTPLIASAFL